MVIKVVSKVNAHYRQTKKGISPVRMHFRRTKIKPKWQTLPFKLERAGEKAEEKLKEKRFWKTVITDPEKIFNVESLFNNIRNLSNEDWDDYKDSETMFGDEDIYEYYLSDIVDSHAGVYMPFEASDLFDIPHNNVDDPNDIKDPEEISWMWEDIERVADKMAENLNAKVPKDIRKKCPNGSFYFGNLEADGSYGLFWRWGKDA